MQHKATQIVKRLQDAGYLAYFAGGCVRDKLLGIEPKDYDITTNARPEQVEALFEKTLEVGKAFGVVMIIEDDIQFEIATFRAEHGYSDGRRPDVVTFSDTPQEDVIRRDFTINGLLEDPIAGKILDFVGGVKDLKAKVVRTIGMPRDRFKEDHLRMLRAIRFSCRFGFEIEEKTLHAIIYHRSKLHSISKERIREELVKILTSNDQVSGMQMLRDTKLLYTFLPEMEPMVGLEQGRYHNKDAYEHTMDVLGGVRTNKLEVRLAALLHDIGKPATRESHSRNEYSFYGHEEEGEKMAEKILRRLKFPNSLVSHVSKLVGLHMGLRGFRKGDLKDRSLRKFARKCGSQEMLEDALELMRADFIAHPGNRSKVFDSFSARFKTLKMSGEQMTAKQKVVSGRDVMEAFGLPQGPAVGEMLKKIQELLDEDPTLTKEALLKKMK